MRIELGLIAAPGYATELAEHLAEDLPEVLAERASEPIEWSVEVVSDPLAADPRSEAVDMIDAARRRLRQEGWDLAVVLTDLPLRIGRRPVVADASATHGVALMSLPALGAVQLRRRAREAIARLADGLMGESLDLDLDLGRSDGWARRRRVGRRLAELAAPVRRVIPADEAVDLRFVAAVVRGNLRLLMGMVRANRPWRLIARLSRALAASLTAVAVAVVTSDVWRISDRLAWPGLLALSVGAVVVTVGWLIAAHGLWERPASERRREQAVLFNVVTTLTVALGVACLYAALFTLTLVVARVMIDPGLMAEELGHPARLGDYAGLAWLVSSMATVGGALGAALESDSAVREAAYGYRPERQAERDARVDSQ